MEELSCALRALNLCDGDQVVDYRCAHAHVACYTAAIAQARSQDAADAVSELQADRARTVARSARLKALTDRRQWMLSAGESRPPF